MEDRDAPQVIEPACIMPVCVDGIAHARVIGGRLHVAFYADHVGIDGGIERVIVSRHICPIDSEIEIRAKVDAALAEGKRQATKGNGITAVH